jgi:hypothetical protein
MHFGLYLKKKGVITADQFVAAVEAQLNSLPRIGQLAMEAGIISPRDIFDILRAQDEYPNIRFGELAIEMGLMTHEELTRLLMEQTDRKRPLADILVAQGVLTADQKSAELREFRLTLDRKRGSSLVPSKIARASGIRSVMPANSHVAV